MSRSQIQALHGLQFPVQRLPLQGGRSRSSANWFRLEAFRVSMLAKTRTMLVKNLLWLSWIRLDVQFVILSFRELVCQVKLLHYHLTGCGDMPWQSHWRMHRQCIRHRMWILRGKGFKAWGKRGEKRLNKMWWMVLRSNLSSCKKCFRDI